MTIISHRGFWNLPEEKNTATAFLRSFVEGFGTETDLRDQNGQLVIAHNPPLADEKIILFSEFCEIYLKSPVAHLPLALNIKADGLQQLLKREIDKFALKNFFVFDMSIPDTIGYINESIPIYSRISEYEQVPAFYEQAAGLWVDAFKGIWFTPKLIEKYLSDGKQLCFVSPDLHKRDEMTLWKMMKDNRWDKQNHVVLCTDFPDKATKYFQYE